MSIREDFFSGWLCEFTVFSGGFDFGIFGNLQVSRIAMAAPGLLRQTYVLFRLAGWAGCAGVCVADPPLSLRDISPRGAGGEGICFRTVGVGRGSGAVIEVGRFGILPPTRSTWLQTAIRLSGLGDRDQLCREAQCAVEFDAAQEPEEGEQVCGEEGDERSEEDAYARPVDEESQRRYDVSSIRG